MTVRALIDGSEPRIALQTQYHHRDQAKSLPGSTWSAADRMWKLPLAWTSLLALRTTFGDDLDVDPDLNAWAWAEYKNRIEPANALREIIQLDNGKQRHPNVKDEGGIPTYDECDDPLERAEGVPDTPIVAHALLLQKELKLYPHQAAGAAFMATSMQCGIFDETGTGKSAQSIAALRILHRMGHNVFPVLIIAPNSVKKPWQRELAQWWPGLTVSMVGGGAAARRKALEAPAHVYIMNWDLLAKHSRLAKYGNHALARCKECGGLDERITIAKCEVHKRELNYLTFNTVIGDEIHRAKSPTSKWTRALWAASEEAQYRFGLTGTPIQDTLVDLWAILRFISPSEYSAKSKFVDRFAETGYSMWGVFTVFGVRKDAEAEFYGGFYPRMRRMLKKIVLPFLPPIVREQRFVEMVPAQAKAYRQLVKDMIADIEGGSLVVENPLSRATRLMQFASAYAELDIKELDDGRVETNVRLMAPSNKVNAVISDIQSGDYGESSLIIFTQSRQLLEILSAEMEKKKLEHVVISGAVSTDARQDAIDKFQAKKVRYILVTIDAGGVGLTLTAAEYMIFLQRHYSSTAQKQAESRGHRIGSEVHEKITIVDYISEDTIEEAQLVKLDGKYGRIESIIRDEQLLLKLLKAEDITPAEQAKAEEIHGAEAEVEDEEDAE